jgi:hypothetical protein
MAVCSYTREKIALFYVGNHTTGELRRAENREALIRLEWQIRAS